jgi:flagellin
MSDLTRINTNVGAIQALNSLKSINTEFGIRQLRLATGKRINSAEDDAAGWVIGKTLEAKARGMAVALSNVGDAKNVLGIAEGGLSDILDVLTTMKEKITQAASDTLGSAERDAVENQLDDLASEIDAIVSRTEFNGVSLIDGTYTGKSFQVGSETTDVLSVGMSQDHAATDLAVADGDLVVDSAANASTALSSVNAAITTVNNSIRSLGSVQARLTINESSLATNITNTQAAKSRILDADMAMEQLEAVKLQILQQTATAALAQANSSPQAILALFR